jgi:hypothetical protein
VKGTLERVLHRPGRDPLATCGRCEPDVVAYAERVRPAVRRDGGHLVLRSRAEAASPRERGVTDVQELGASRILHCHETVVNATAGSIESTSKARLNRATDVVCTGRSAGRGVEDDGGLIRPEPRVHCSVRNLSCGRRHVAPRLEPPGSCFDAHLVHGPRPAPGLSVPMPFR